MEEKKYAYLPEDILIQLLKDSPKTAKKISEKINFNKKDIKKGREQLVQQNLIKKIDNNDYTYDLIAVDGANIIEHMTSSDLLMAIAVGVEGLQKNPSYKWKGNKAEQFYQWQEVLPHHVANTRLAQGIMFLMELSILANAKHEIRIMDGSHITSILKLNSLLSAKDDEFADEEYVKALSYFLQENYEKVIPDIPDILQEAFQNSNIIALAKYSSSRDILDSYLKDLQIIGDDKTFFSLILHEDEYTVPLKIGQSEKERKQWEMIHIKCNLDIRDLSENDKKTLNESLDKTLNYFRPQKEGNLYYLYYKPFENGICYRIEIKKELADNTTLLEKYLKSIKKQTFYPEILEPYPQYLADMIAKNISFSMQALKQAIRSNRELLNNETFHLLFSYRSQ